MHAALPGACCARLTRANICRGQAVPIRREVELILPLQLFGASLNAFIDSIDPKRTFYQLKVSPCPKANVEIC
jgi:hypothetical protein